MPADLPILARREAIVSTLLAKRRLVVTAPTGSGKSTQLPQMLLDSGDYPDQILVLESGQIIERGTHAELLGVDGRYRELYDTQYRFEHDRFINPGEDFTPEPEPVKL